MSSDGPGTWGHQEWPLLVSRLQWVHIEPLIKRHMRHVHVYPSRQCVLNSYGEPCPVPEGATGVIDCGHQDCHRPAVTHDHGRWLCGGHLWL